MAPSIACGETTSPQAGGLGTFAETAPVIVDIGWQPLPLHVPTGNGCSCPEGIGCASPGKHPRVAWPAGQRVDAEQVQRWARRWPDANIGIITGAVSDLLVLDVDPGHGGTESLARLERRYGALPPTLASCTGSRGLHIVFTHPGVRIGPSAGKLGPGLDIRGDRGLIVAPPSLHVSGRRYEWVVGRPGDALAPVPEWMVKALLPPPPRPVRPVVIKTTGLRAYVEAALRRAADAVRQAPDGAKHDVLYRQSYGLGTLVGAGLLDEATAERVLADAVSSRAKSERAALATIRRNLARGKQSPRAVAS